MWVLRWARRAWFATVKSLTDEGDKSYRRLLGALRNPIMVLMFLLLSGCTTRPGEPPGEDPSDSVRIQTIGPVTLVYPSQAQANFTTDWVRTELNLSGPAGTWFSFLIPVPSGTQSYDLTCQTTFHADATSGENHAFLLGPTVVHEREGASAPSENARFLRAGPQDPMEDYQTWAKFGFRAAGIHGFVFAVGSTAPWTQNVSCEVPHEDGRPRPKDAQPLILPPHMVGGKSLIFFTNPRIDANPVVPSRTLEISGEAPEPGWTHIQYVPDYGAPLRSITADTFEFSFPNSFAREGQQIRRPSGSIGERPTLAGTFLGAAGTFHGRWQESIQPSQFDLKAVHLMQPSTSLASFNLKGLGYVGENDL
jgi:hypothetical protein